MYPISYDHWKLQGPKEYPELPELEFRNFEYWLMENRNEVYDEHNPIHMTLLEQWEDEYFESKRRRYNET